MSLPEVRGRIQGGNARRGSSDPPTATDSPTVSTGQVTRDRAPQGAAREARVEQGRSSRGNTEARETQRGKSGTAQTGGERTTRERREGDARGAAPGRTTTGTETDRVGRQTPGTAVRRDAAVDQSAGPTRGRGGERRAADQGGERIGRQTAGPGMTVRRDAASDRTGGPKSGRGGNGKAVAHGGDSGRFKHVAEGQVARRIDLDKQYAMRDKGDVARRMGFDKHGSHHGQASRGGRPSAHGVHLSHAGAYYHRGRVSPHYAKSHFHFGFYWPRYYAAFSSYPISYGYYYPRWSPWVSWSWYYDCGPVWDPRPIYCRPWYYPVRTTWVYWSVPAWEPMPVAASGTWVDVNMEPVPAQQYDLQLLAVRFVDAGHPDEKLGPRYRVWFRNNSNQPIAVPFDVFLFAANDDRMDDMLPRAGVRVASIEAGQTQSVDVRLPFEVFQMGRDEKGQPAPFTTLHVLVDANREIEETSEVNNGTRLASDLVLPVDPVAFEVKPAKAVAGGEVLLAGEGLGPEPGRVVIHLGGIEMDAEILGWFDLGVRLNMPALPLAAPVEAELIVIRRDGAASNPIAVTISPVAIPDEPLEEIVPQPVLEELVLPPAKVE
ncbi:MAG: hypothetical protein GX621_09360 [Pirellulaceae bacterium]|nr:hypothetical protein [Pirellulaceae bacterium]